MRKDSILANYYYKKLPKYQEQPGTVTAPAKKKKTMVFAETNYNDPFVTEGNEVKQYLKNLSPNEDVQVYNIYDDEAKMRELLANSDENTRLAFFAHHGANLYGNPAENLGQMLQNTTYGDCYLGSCFSGDIAAKPEFANLQNFHFRPGYQDIVNGRNTTRGKTWQGFNPNTKTSATGENAFNEAMFNTTSDPRYFNMYNILDPLYTKRANLYDKYKTKENQSYAEVSDIPGYKKEFEELTNQINAGEAKKEKYYTTVMTPQKGVDYDILNPTTGGHKASGEKYITKKEKLEMERQKQLAQIAADQSTKVTDFLSSKFRDGGNASSLNYRNGLPKVKSGRMIQDPRGQWAHPGENTRIPGGNITMQGVPYPVFGRANTGQQQMMYPGQQYSFPGARHVDEYPMMQGGGDISIPQLSTQVPSWAGKYADGGLTKYQVAGTVCPTGFNKNAFGQCVNASGQTPEQAKAALSGINLSGNTSTAFDGSKYSGNLGSTGVNRMNDENTPAGRLHTATLAYLKRFPQMTYQQALDNVQRGQSSIKNQGTMRAMTPDEIEKNRIDTENEKVRKSNKIYQTSLEKSEGMQADAKEHDKEQQDFLDAKAAIDTGTPYTFPNGKTKLWKEMDGREKAYVHGRKHRLDLQIAPEVKAAGPFNLSDEIKLNLESLNPFSTASRWYAQGAEAPWMARETNSITPYIAAIADPALTIAAASIGAPVEGNVVKYGVKNAFNPLKPFKELKKLGEAMAIGNLENHLIEQGIKKTKKWTMKSGIPTLEKDLLTGPEDGQEEIPVSPWRPVEPNEDVTTGDAIPLPKNIAVNQQTVDPTRGLKMGGKVIKQIGGRVNKNNWLSKYI